MMQQIIENFPFSENSDNGDQTSRINATEGKIDEVSETVGRF